MFVVPKSSNFYFDKTLHCEFKAITYKIEEDLWQSFLITVDQGSHIWINSIKNLNRLHVSLDIQHLNHIVEALFHIEPVLLQFELVHL